MNMKRSLGILLVGTLLLSMTACSGWGKGEGFDAKQYVEDVLEAKYHQDYTAYAKGLGISKEEAKEQLTSEFDASLVKKLAGIEMIMTEEEIAQNQQIEADVRSKIQFEVQEAVKNEDGTYQVDVVVTPIDAYELFQDAFFNNIQEAVNDGATEEDYMNVYLESLQYSVDNAPEAEQTTYTFYVLFEENKDGEKIYYIHEQEMLEFDRVATCQ